MSELLTIVGASARAAAASAVRAGYSMRAADLFADLDLCRLGSALRVGDYPDGLARALAGSHGGGWMYTGALENFPAQVDEWSRFRPLWGNPARVLANVRQPQLVAAALRQAGLRYPALCFEAADVPRDGSWLCKSLRSAGGVHVQAWGQRSPVDLPPDHYLQQFIVGTSCSAVYLAARGDSVLLGITRQLDAARWTGAEGLRYCGSLGPLEVSADADAQFARIGQVLARDFDLVGLFGVDAVVNAEGVWPLEVNPRYTASVEILERAYEIHAVALHVAACRAGELPARPTRVHGVQHAKAILFASRRFEVSADVHALDEQAARQQWPAWADLPRSGSVIEAGWPILTVFAAADTDHAALEALQSQATTARRMVER